MIGYVLAGARIFSPEIFTKSHHDERTSAPSSTAVFVVAMPLPGRRDDGGKETRYSDGAFFSMNARHYFPAGRSKNVTTGLPNL